MGKATILDGGQDGRYLVRIERDRERAQAEIARLMEENQALAQRLPELDAELAVAQGVAEQAGAALDDAVDTLAQVGTESAQREIAAASVKQRQTAFAAAAREVARIQNVRRVALIRQAANGARIAYLEGQIGEDPIREVWCADLNEGVTGTVGTIEIGGEPGHVIIRPAGVEGTQAGHSPERDGQMQPTASSTPAAAFYNYALLPGWEKWRPRYRAGIISSLDGDTCTVQIFHLTATHQGLNVNQGTVLQNVPILYLDCNGEAFSVGDRVVVEFVQQNFSAPRVIGFLDNPMPCEQRLSGFVFSAQGMKVVDIAENGNYLVKIPTFTPQYGNIDWQGPNGLVLSWGGENRYFDQAVFGHGRTIFKDGKPFVVLPPEYSVLGAAIAGEKIVIVVQPYYWQNAGADLYEMFLFADLSNTLDLRIGHVRYWGGEKVTSGRNTTPWIFSESGTKAIAKRRVGETYNYYRATINPQTETVTITEGEVWGTVGTKTEVVSSNDSGSWNKQAKFIHKFIEYDGEREVESFLNFEFEHNATALRTRSGEDTFEHFTCWGNGIMYFDVDGDRIFSKNMTFDHIDQLLKRKPSLLPPWMGGGLVDIRVESTSNPYEDYYSINFSMIDCRTKSLSACFFSLKHEHVGTYLAEWDHATLQVTTNQYLPENGATSEQIRWVNSWGNEEVLSLLDLSGKRNRFPWKNTTSLGVSSGVEQFLSELKNLSWPDPGWHFAPALNGVVYMPGQPSAFLGWQINWVPIYMDNLQGRAYPHPKNKNRSISAGHKRWDSQYRFWHSDSRWVRMSDADPSALVGAPVTPATIGVV
ncbi:hypothetical protein [Geoalkalibacter sp.]|uniref:hypothetical protein n=1 Tax=Geoalkalibacter sp. TaxID=3041440 RepID=UPI00272E5BFD|nr:hypothetical protein [Geoalkalibacter sp.]